MPDSNLRQADVPEGATIIPQTKGTAPGLICPVGHKVVYAVPGVPYEMADMFERAIAPDLQRRMAERGESSGTIASRVIRTWGMSESGLAETLADYIDGLDDQAGGRTRRAARPPSPSWPAASRASRCGSPCGPPTTPRPPPLSTRHEAAIRRDPAPRRPATWCSASTTRPSRTPWPGSLAGRRPHRWAWPSR